LDIYFIVYIDDKRRAKKTNNVSDQPQQEQERNNGIFQPKKHSPTTNGLKTSGLRQSSINFFPSKHNHYEEKPSSTTTDKFNVWGDSPPVSHNVRVAEKIHAVSLNFIYIEVCRRV
jgi:hypothetical protein